MVDWLVCGLAIGLSFEVYFAARVAGLLVAVYLVYRAVRERDFIQANARGLVALIFGAVVFLAPMAAVYGRSPGSFGARTGGVLITNPENLQHEFDGYQVNTFAEVVAIQARRTLEAFNIHGETSLQYGHTTPLLDFWTGGLLAMSALAVLLRPDSSRGVLLAAWVWLTLALGSVMTLDALFSPRVLLALPALLIGPALILERGWRGVGRLAGRVGSVAFTVPVVTVLGLALQANVHDFFDVQVVERAPAGRFTLLSTYAQTIADRYRMYAIGRDDWSLSTEATQFLLPNLDAVDVRSAPLKLPLERVPPNKGVAFLVENAAADYMQRLDDMHRSYPGGQETLIVERSGSPLFTSYLVENTALIAADPAAVRD